MFLCSISSCVELKREDFSEELLTKLSLNGFTSIGLVTSYLRCLQFVWGHKDSRFDERTIENIVEPSAMLYGLATHNVVKDQPPWHPLALVRNAGMQVHTQT